MTLLKCNYLIFTNLLFSFILLWFQNIWEKCTHSHFFSIISHWFSLFLVSFKSLLALLPFKARITRGHSDDKGFYTAGEDLIFQFCIRASHFQCIVGAQPEIQCLTVCVPPGSFEECDHGVSECQSLHDSVKSNNFLAVLNHPLAVIRSRLTPDWGPHLLGGPDLLGGTPDPEPGMVSQISSTFTDILMASF